MMKEEECGSVLVPQSGRTEVERFHIELNPDHTTVVSWKKLLKEAAAQQRRQSQPQPQPQPPAGAHPGLEARIAPEVGTAAQHSDPLPPPTNRFSSVIEKIERLYKGAHSSDDDENLSDAPDDDRYDTSDSFIDDEELDDYFSVDKEKIKHSGFFVNRGKLEKLVEPVASPIPAPNKRKQKDIKKMSPSARLKKTLQSGVKSKVAAARKVPAIGPLDPSASGNLISVPFVSEKNIKENTAAKKSKERLVKPKTEKEREGTREVKSEGVTTLSGKVATSIQIKETLHSTLDSKGLIDSINIERQKDTLPTSKCPVVLSQRGKVDSGAILQKSNLIAYPEANFTDLTKEMATTVSNKTKQGQRGLTDDEKLEGRKLNAGNASQKTITPNGKDISPSRLKGTTLERAIQDLEKDVLELCPSAFTIRKIDQASPSGGKRNRLPRDVRQKLAKVARLAEKQGRISDDLVKRLMGILGHVMQVKTLKKNLKDMIERGKSAMEEKEGRIKHMKREVTDMVNSRVYSLQAQVLEQRQGSSDEFQTLSVSGEKTIAGRFPWDQATEDHLCDLYDQYIDGIDEHRGPQIRKLYAELVGLWPEGWMDKIGIKHAVQRARQRKRRRNKIIQRREELRKKQKASVKQMEEVVTPGMNLLDQLQSQPGKEAHQLTNVIRDDSGGKVTAMKKKFKVDNASVPQTKEPKKAFVSPVINMLEKNSPTVQTLQPTPLVNGNL